MNKSYSSQDKENILHRTSLEGKPDRKHGRQDVAAACRTKDNATREGWSSAIRSELVDECTFLPYKNYAVKGSSKNE